MFNPCMVYPWQFFVCGLNDSYVTINVYTDEWVEKSPHLKGSGSQFNSSSVYTCWLFLPNSYTHVQAGCTCVHCNT